MYSNVEWKERVEKWKAKQEKGGLVSKDDGGDDQGDEDDVLYDSNLSLLHVIT